MMVLFSEKRIQAKEEEQVEERKRKGDELKVGYAEYELTVGHSDV